MSEEGRRGRRWRLFQMSFYRDSALPHLVNMSMKQTNFERYRRRVVAEARGRILNLPAVRRSA